MLSEPVLIHGWGFSSKIFEGFRGIKPDLPGHGRGPDHYEGIEGLVDYLSGFLREEHDLVGWSLGGSLALLLYMKFPGKIRRIFLIGATPCFRRAWSLKNIRAFRMMFKREGIGAFRRLAGQEGFEDRVREDILHRMLEDYVNLDLEPLLSEVRAEVFIIHGRNDRVVPPAEAEKLHGRIRGSKLFMLEGGHFPVRDEETLVREVFQIR
jgi:pimeloyl-[acyl-carrier protein] methyl ester esterase